MADYISREKDRLVSDGGRFLQPGREEVQHVTEVKNYICDVCLAPYLDPVEAKKCEKSHRLPVEVENMLYRGSKTYPDVISVRMSDGKTLWYGIGSDRLL